MEFSTSFIVHFVFSFVGFQFLGIFLCRGSWRNSLRRPLYVGIIFLILSHVHIPNATWFILPAISIASLGLIVWRAFKQDDFVPSEIRQGHNFFGILVGAALFAITSQLHDVLFGVPVFQLVK
jgi:hypothetical protein